MSRRPVVLHVAAVEFTAKRLLLPQLSFLAQQGFDVFVACAPQGTTFDHCLRPFNPLTLRFPRSLDPLGMAAGGRDLLSLVRRMRPDVVHFHSPAASIPGRMALAVAGSRPRVVYTVHGFLQEWNSRRARDRLAGTAERWLARVTNSMLFQSREDYEQAQAHHYHSRLRHLGNGVSDDWFDDQSPRHRKGPLRAIFVGRLTREKGLGELLEAVRRQPKVQWTIIGDALPSDRDPMTRAVKRCAATLDGRVSAVGMLGAEEVRKHLAGADLFVLPSWREGLPRSVIEAMASGLPVVATDIRGCRELVQPGVNGWLVPPRDADRLIAALDEAAWMPGDRLRAMGDASRAAAWRDHREQAVFSRIVDAYRELGVAP